MPKVRVWSSGGHEMLEVIAILLVIAWLLGVLSAYTLGGGIHLLLLLAAFVIVLRLWSGGRRNGQ